MAFDVESVQVTAEEAAMAASRAARALERATLTDGKPTKEEKRVAIEALSEASTCVDDALVALEEERRG